MPPEDSQQNTQEKEPTDSANVRGRKVAPKKAIIATAGIIFLFLVVSAVYFFLLRDDTPDEPSAVSETGFATVTEVDIVDEIILDSERTAATVEIQDSEFAPVHIIVAPDPGDEAMDISITWLNSSDTDCDLSLTLLDGQAVDEFSVPVSEETESTIELSDDLLFECKDTDISGGYIRIID